MPTQAKHPNAYTAFTGAIQKQADLQRDMESTRVELEGLHTLRSTKVQASGDPRKLGSEIAAIDGTADVLSHRLEIATKEHSTQQALAIRTATEAALGCGSSLRTANDEYTRKVDTLFIDLGVKLQLGRQQSGAWSMFTKPDAVLNSEKLSARLFDIGRDGHSQRADLPGVVLPLLEDYLTTLEVVEQIIAGIDNV